MKQPIIEKIGTKSEFGTHTPWYVAVHSHPLLQKKYSYAIAIDYMLERNPAPIADFDSCLFGCYGTPDQALSAGVEQVQSQ